MTGRVLSRYRLLEEVGRGGMAVVYRGLDPMLGREVAVKVLHPHLVGVAEARARLEREAQAVAKLRHENILEIFDYSGSGEIDSFLVTEFIRGETLTAFSRRHPIELPEVAAMILAEVAAALEHAHGLGVIHRDVKPENVMIRCDGAVKLTDFGIAQVLDKERLTVTGQLLGSPAYMAPEHIDGGRIDGRTDVFAVGTMLYQLATGRLPFDGRNPHEMLKRIAEGRFVPPDAVNPLVGARLARVIARALARDPGDRYPTAAALRADLLAVLADAGVTDVRAELARYFADPDGWARAFRPRLVERLAARGSELVRAGRTAPALALWGQALALAPGEPRVVALIDGLTRRRRRRSGVLVTAALAAAAALGGTGWRRLDAHRGERRATARAAAESATANAALAGASTGSRPAAAVPTASAPVMSSTGSGAAPTAGGPAGAPPPRPSTTVAAAVATSPTAGHLAVAPPPHHPPAMSPREKGRYVTISTTQKNVDIYVDDALVGRYDGNPIHVAPGPHHLVFRNESCSDYHLDLAADQTSFPTVTLKYKAAHLVIEATPPSASVTYRVAGEEHMAESGRRSSIKVPPYGNGSVDVDVFASAPGFHPTSEHVIVHAGENPPLALVLKPVQ